MFDFFPAGQLFFRQGKFLQDSAPPFFTNGFHGLKCLIHHPAYHDIAVGVIA